MLDLAYDRQATSRLGWILRSSDGVTGWSKEKPSLSRERVKAMERLAPLQPWRQSAMTSIVLRVAAGEQNPTADHRRRRSPSPVAQRKQPLPAVGAEESTRRSAAV